MSRFLDQLDKDNTNVFYNLDEFAKEINWNGYPIIVVDETPTESLQFTHGIEKITVIYRVQKTGLTKPSFHERVNINDELWIVRSVQEQINDFVIRLDRFED